MFSYTVCLFSQLYFAKKKFRGREESMISPKRKHPFKGLLTQKTCRGNSVDSKEPQKLLAPIL